MTAIDLKELFVCLKTDFGITVTAIISPSWEVYKEKSKFNLFDVILENLGENKIGAIKGIRELMGLSLVDAKNLVERCPVKIGEGLSKTHADLYKNVLSEKGSIVRIVPV